MRLPLLSAAAVVSVFAFAVPAFATTGCNAVGWEEGWFSDVRGCHSYYPAIRYVKEQGIVRGYPDGTFKPEQPINRAEFATILMGVRGLDGPVCTTIPFNDVDQTAWYARSVNDARCQGTIDGYPDGSFKPGNVINYAESAKIAANAYDLTISEPNEWDDRWYAPFSHALLKRFAVPPTVGSYQSSLTRGEMAEMIYRLETGKSSMDWFASLGSESYVYGSWVTDMFPDIEFVYDGTSFSADEGYMSVPDVYAKGKYRTFPALHLSHVRPAESEEWCNGMAGLGPWCRPSTSKIEISIGIVDRPVEYLALGMGWRDVEDVDPVAGRDVRGFWDGIECEGDASVFVPLDETRSIVISRTYECNEQREEYLSGEEQQHVFRTFLNSISTEVPYREQNAPTMDVTVLMCDSNVPYGSPDASAPTVRTQWTVPSSTAVADMTLQALFQAYGNAHVGSRECPGVSSVGASYRGVTIIDGVATVKLTHSFGQIFGGEREQPEPEQDELSAQRSITANLKQFPSVQSVRYVVQP